MKKLVLVAMVTFVTSQSCFSQVGDWPASSMYTYFGVTTLDQTIPNNYALLQEKANGRTFLNSSLETHFRIWNTDMMILTNAGRFGIGTITPVSTLHMRSSGTGPHLVIETDTNGEGDLCWYQGGAGSTNQRAALQVGTGTGNFEGWVYGADWQRWMVVDRMTGNVGFGTPSTPDAKLAVKGTIHTQEVKVDLAGAVAPDYVFADNYTLPSLATVKSFINKNKHLPEVPSADEMAANGMNVKEMNLLLLKKIEELTLYIIKQEERITELERK